MWYNLILVVFLFDELFKEYFEKIINIVDEILKFIFIEVVDLNELLKVNYFFNNF